MNPAIGAFNTLMLSHVFHSLPTARHHAWACSAGSKGYCATKDMLQNGIPGHTLLIESNDLRDVESSASEGDECCLVYVFSRPFADDPSVYKFEDHIPNTTKHVTSYSNWGTMPRLFLFQSSFSDEIGISTIDLSPLKSTQVTIIKESFLSGNAEVATIDLSPLSHVTEGGGRREGGSCTQAAHAGVPSGC